VILLFEGPDASGKTTLVESLIKRNPGTWEIHHHGAFPTPNAAFTAYERLLESISENPRNVLIDRMHISERIYGQYFHNIWMSDRRYWYIDKVCNELDVRLVWCLPPWRAVRKIWHSRIDDEMIKDESQLEQVYDAYNAIAEYTNLDTILYDYTQPGAFEDFGKWVEGEIE
jgi:thymidylate kinase